LLKQTTIRSVWASLILFLLSPLILSAQDQTPQAAPPGRATGIVRTAGGVPIPGANLRLLETTTGRAWVSWTDENGHFDLPGLPHGHYRMEASQLGFESAVQEFDLNDTPGAINVTLKVASLASMEAAAAPAQNPVRAPAAARETPKPAVNDSAGASAQAPEQGASQ
jgi:hypothetical protein